MDIVLFKFMGMTHEIPMDVFIREAPQTHAEKTLVLPALLGRLRRGEVVNWHGAEVSLRAAVTA